MRRLLTFGRESAGQETALKTFKYPKGGLQTLVDILIERVESRDARFELRAGQGTDSIHNTEEWAYATALLQASDGLTGSGLAMTLGGGNHLVCRAIEDLAEPLVGREIEELMSSFGAFFRSIAEHIGLSRDGVTLYYSTNVDDIDRRHIWRVPTAGGTVTRISKGKGIETFPAALGSGDRIALLSAGVNIDLGQQ